MSEFPNRRRLEPTGIENTYDVVRAEGNVTETGDPFAEDSMNDLEERIAAGLAEGSISTALHTRTGTVNNLVVPTGAKNLTFLATADIADGDTWTVNSTAVTAVLQNGEPLPGELFKAGCWVTGVRLSDDGTQLFFKGGAATVPSIFGNGSDGDAVITGTVTLPVPVPHQSIVEKQYKSLTINAGALLKCAAHNAGLIIRVQGDCVVHGTIDQSGLAPKTNPQNTYPYPAQLVCGDGGNGGGIFASTKGLGMLKRPYGGGYSGGGDGGAYGYGVGKGGDSTGITIDIPDIFLGGVGSKTNGNPGKYGGGGSAGGNINKPTYTGGDGGSGPGADGISQNGLGGGGAGNYGGGVILLYVGGSLTIDGSIKCNGLNGGAGGTGSLGGSGGGGAGGGAIYILHRGTYINTGLLQVNGGAAGVGYADISSGIDGAYASAGGIGSITVIQQDK